MGHLGGGEGRQPRRPAPDPRLIDRTQSRVSVGAAYEGDMQHSWPFDIVHKKRCWHKDIVDRCRVSFTAEIAKHGFIIRQVRT
jgi:hypothetical protein